VDVQDVDFNHRLFDRYDRVGNGDQQNSSNNTPEESTRISPLAGPPSPTVAQCASDHA
jgi:hypothetical protein